MLLKGSVFSIVLLSTLCASAAQATEVQFAGTSASYIFDRLSTRAEGVTKRKNSPSKLRSIEKVSLYNLIECERQQIWMWKSYSCSLGDSNNQDILGVDLESVGQDALSDAIGEVNRAFNRQTTLPLGGMSASRLFSKLLALRYKDKTFYVKQGTTRILKRDFVGLGIDEVYCQMTHGILGDSYRCFIFDTTIADSNVTSIGPKPRPGRPQ